MQTLVRLGDLFFSGNCGANMSPSSNTSFVIPMFNGEHSHLGCQDDVLLKVSRFVECCDV